jgi:membrane peptidoglycan carboxypeptidase
VKWLPFRRNGAARRLSPKHTDRRPRLFRTPSYLAALTRAGLISGIVVAGAAFPLAAVAAMGVFTLTDYIHSLPSDMRDTPSAQVTYAYAADGVTPIAQFYEEYRRYIPLSQVSPYVQRAIVASEDARFYDHKGVDTRGLLRAFAANQNSGGVSQGASTLTMQYVRNVQRDSARTPQEVSEATAQSTQRKLREMRMAVAAEKRLTKEQILEGYLNVAYFGHRAYGIYAAAEVYFSKLPSELTLPEAAMLAGLVQAPSSYDPASRDQTAALERRNYVLDRMVQVKFLSPAQAEQAKQTPIQLRLTDPPNDCIGVNPAHRDWGFFCDLLKSWWRQQPAFGDNPLQREENLRRGGYTIVTSLDPKLQAIAMEEVTSRESIGSSYALGMVAVQPGTGRIQAAAVNRNYSLDQSRNGRHTLAAAARAGIKGTYPNTVAPLLGGGGVAGYQAGSTFKIFTILAALEMGLPLNTRINSPHRIQSQYPSGGASSCNGFWCPSNASAAMAGVHTMWSGFGQSVNTFFVQLEQMVGAERVVRMAERLGLTWRTEVDRRLASPENANNWGAFTLGVSDATPIEMANVYATLAADGIYCEANPIISITDSRGRPVAAGNPQCKQVISAEVARGAVDVTRCPPGGQPHAGSCGGWSTAPGIAAAVGRPMGGKTGTTDDTRAAWFVGFTPELAVAAFIADPDNPFHLAGDGNAPKTNNAVAGLLKRGLEGLPVRDFPPPAPSTVGR